KEPAMLNTLMTKPLSLLTSLALLMSTFPAVAVASPAPTAPATPDFVKALTPPSHLGFLDPYYQGSTQKPVVLIQDLHANYGVQKKIYGILNNLGPKITQGGRPIVIGLEGAWGDID